MSAGATVLRARLVLPMGGAAPIENGAIASEDGRITEVGRFPEIRSGGNVIDAGDSILMPGLINAHCHLDYTCLRGKIPPPRASFTDWIRGINAAKAKLTPADYVESINEGFREAKQFGTVAMANLTAFPELIEQTCPILETTWFAELIDVRPGTDPTALMVGALGKLEGLPRIGLAPHAPYTASAPLYRLCAMASKHARVRLTTHLAESREEMMMFQDATGPLFEFLRDLGRDMSDCGRKTPLANFLSSTDDQDRWLVAHLNELEKNDLALLSETGRRFDVVHCPRSHRFFGHAPFAFEELKAMGFRIALGTDSLASNDDLSLFAEMREFHRSFPDVPPGVVVAMTTSIAAELIGEGARLGRLANGYLAKPVAIPFRGNIYNDYEVYEAVIDFRGQITADFPDSQTAA